MGPTENSSPQPPIVALAFLLYMPDEDFLPRLEQLSNGSYSIYVVNNGASQGIRERLNRMATQGRIVHLENERNLGVAAGYNRAFRRAIDEGVDWLVTLDQDSEPSAEIIDLQKQALLSLKIASRVGLLAPSILEPDSGKRMRYLVPGPLFGFSRVSCESRSKIENALIVLNSGAMFNLEAVRKAGLLREDFFVDYVDSEYCLRLRSQGYRTLVVCDAVLPHHLGDRVERRLGPLRFYPTFHPPVRWYYISRNRIPMLRMYALKFPHWLSFEIISSVYIFLRMLLFEDQRWKKLQAIWFGTLDGLRGRMGKIRPELEEVLAVQHDAGG